MRRPFVQALLGAVVGGLLVLSLPAIAEMTPLAASGNADKVDGNHAHQLGRVMWSWTALPHEGPSENPLDLADGTITAPKPGWIRVLGGFSVANSDIALIPCYLKVNSQVLPIESWAVNGTARGSCTVAALIEVPRGEHLATLFTEFPGDVGVFFDAYVTAEYYRFNAEGKKSKCTEFPCPSFGTTEEGTGAQTGRG